MITRAIVESIEDAYHVKVRVPTLDRALNSNVHSDTTSLNSATICTLAQYDPNIQVGDVVFVAFEDRALSSPVVIGYLYRGEKNLTYADQVLRTLEVTDTAKLPVRTQIGSISYGNLMCLSGCHFQIREAIESLQADVVALKKQLNMEVEEN